MKKHWMQIAIVMLASLSWETIAQDKSAAGVEFAVNGLKVLVKPGSANDIISVQLYLRGGCLNLTEATQGIESLIFQSALKGSKNFPKERLNTILDKSASAINSASTKDFSMVNLRCLKSDFDKLWEVYADAGRCRAGGRTGVCLVRAPDRAPREVVFHDPQCLRRDRTDT